MATTKKPNYSTINLFIRSFVFSIYSWTTIPLYSFVCMLALAFPLSYRHALIRAYLRLYLHVLKYVCLINYQVKGLENIPHDRTGIILSKHQSTWETFFLPTIFHDPAIIVKKELLWVPFFGWGLATSDPIAIDRNNKSSAMQQVIEKGARCLQAGRWVLIFPEGTRIPAGQVGKYRLGGARLAVASGYPVIPIAHNAGYFWPKRKFIKQPGTIQVVIGPLIESKGRTPEEVLELTKNWIENTVKKIK
ncbi:MAG: hypothetical protein A3F42_03140 [Gammaproteobacteria bacterium RIFCSPHIGHO2_12_FULL_37_34]|nr:MAG: hypothetical protein A3F42_03140 [Gammaproteobacteria bacterium RIFCSPHIGHO2_12_FULL_37_34]